MSAKDIEKYQFKAGEISSSVAAENGRKGGLKKAENNRMRKTFAQLIAERMGEEDYNEMVDNLIKRAKKKDRSFETLRDTVGEMPVKPINISQEEPFKIEIETLNEDTKNV